MTNIPETSSEDWETYYKKTGARPPRRTLLFALNRFDAERSVKDPNETRRFAIDLGCGSGRDTVEILRRGWRVLAIDAEPKAIAGLESRSDIPPGVDLAAQLLGRVARFEQTELPSADLVNSSFALPLVPAADFPALWARIVAALRPGGRVACQLYGERDQWAGDPGITVMTREEAQALLAPLEIEMFEEEDDDSVTPRGMQKHWHIFHIVARKV